MKEKYKFSEPAVSVELRLEQGTAEMLRKMSHHTGIDVSQLANMALKFFASTHRDFFPAISAAKNKKATSPKA